MKAEKRICEWLEKKYGGSKELGDWTPKDVMEFAEWYKDAELKEAMELLNELRKLVHPYWKGRIDYVLKNKQDKEKGDTEQWVFG